MCQLRVWRSVGESEAAERWGVGEGEGDGNGPEEEHLRVPGAFSLVALVVVGGHDFSGGVRVNVRASFGLDLKRLDREWLHLEFRVKDEFLG